MYTEIIHLGEIPCRKGWRTQKFHERDRLVQLLKEISVGKSMDQIIKQKCISEFTTQSDISKVC